MKVFLLAVCLTFFVKNSEAVSLAFSTFLGGNNEDLALSVVVSPSGKIFIAGETLSPDFPVTAGSFDTSLNGFLRDAFVTKLNPNGTSLIFSTYLGGSYGNEFVSAIKIDQNENVYVCGNTTSENFPVIAGSYDTSNNGYDIFITKIHNYGTTLLYSTFLGGYNKEYYTKTSSKSEIQIDLNNNVYISGVTGSVDFPTTPGVLDTSFVPQMPHEVFITKLNNSGSDLIFSTFLGADSSSDFGTSIVIDNFENIYVTGAAYGLYFPTTPGAFDTILNTQDTFVSKLNSLASNLIYSTFLGGSITIGGFNDYEMGNSIAVNGNENAYICGIAFTIDFPIVPGSYDVNMNGGNDAFVTKFNSTGSALVYSTFLGGSSEENSFSVSLAQDGSVFVAGETLSSNFPTTTGSFDTTFDGNSDAFFSKLNPTGDVLSYSTFLGGSDEDYANSVFVSPNQSAYVVGFTKSSDFPVVSGSFDTTFNDTSDAFLSRLNFPQCSLSLTTVDFDTVEVFASATQNVSIFSTGSDTLKITFKYLSGNFTTNLTVPASVLPGNLLEFGVTFAPQTAGNFNGLLVIYTNSGNYTVSLHGTSVYAGVETSENLQNSYKLEQNYPNPFNPETRINYEFSGSERAKLSVFNVKGEFVREFELLETKGSVVWNGTDFSGKTVSSGVYFYRLDTGNGFSETKKMILLK